MGEKKPAKKKATKADAHIARAREAMLAERNDIEVEVDKVDAEMDVLRERKKELNRKVHGYNKAIATLTELVEGPKSKHPKPKAPKAKKPRKPAPDQAGPSQDKVLRALRQSARACTPKDIRTYTGLSEAALYAVLRKLVERQLVVKHKKPGERATYSLPSATPTQNALSLEDQIVAAAEKAMEPGRKYTPQGIISAVRTSGSVPAEGISMSRQADLGRILARSGRFNRKQEEGRTVFWIREGDA